jgi:hypothetical protein
MVVNKCALDHTNLALIIAMLISWMSLSGGSLTTSHVEVRIVLGSVVSKSSNFNYVGF